MKNRNGFVSNSSTSSFIVYGVPISNNQRKEVESCLEEEEFNGLSLRFNHDGSAILGSTLFSDEYLSDGSVAGQELLGIRKKIATLLGDETIAPGIYFGTEEN